MEVEGTEEDCSLSPDLPYHDPLAALEGLACPDPLMDDHQEVVEDAEAEVVEGKAWRTSGLMMGGVDQMDAWVHHLEVLSVEAGENGIQCEIYLVERTLLRRTLASVAVEDFALGSVLPTIFQQRYRVVLLWFHLFCMHKIHVLVDYIDIAHSSLQSLRQMIQNNQN